MSFEDFADVTVGRYDYRILFWFMSEGKTNSKCIAVLT